jgi:hypothetical protein
MLRQLHTLPDLGQLLFVRAVQVVLQIEPLGQAHERLSVEMTPQE